MNEKFEMRFQNTRDPIAIIGMACRLPGGADSPARLWQLLLSNGSGISPFPEGRWDRDAFFHPDPKRPGKLFTQAGGYLKDIDQFDAEFFGISPREASRMDPQHRLLLEMTWEALEDAGQIIERLAGSNTSVFIGISSGDYGHMQGEDLDGINAYTNVGNAVCIAANRLSHFFDFHGPSFSLDTACSSALVALHEACHSIWNGESTMGIAGGINLILRPNATIGFCKASMLSRTNLCRSFDASADGYVRAEGGGVVLLKPLSRAEADGDPIRAIIVASAVNSDGHTTGIFLPNGTAQEKLLREVYRQSGISPHDISYIEAHGTGTLAGDPIECNAIGHVMGAGRGPDHPCLIGSIKSNVGHMEPAAGIAGVLKVVLSLEHHEIPASLHFKKPNPKIPFKKLNLEVVKENRVLPHGSRSLVMGVNSFGFGGTNAHVVLKEYKKPEAPDRGLPEDRLLPLFLSARSQEALRQIAHEYTAMLKRENAPSLYDVCHSAAFRRSRLEHGFVAFGTSRGEIAEKLAAFANGEFPAGTACYSTLSKHAKLALVFSGNGPQWWAMGQELLEREPLFRQFIQKIDAILGSMSGWSIMAEILSGEAESRMDRTEFAQPTLFALQVGTYELLRARGLRGDATLGHSVGEVAAAYASGALSLEQAVQVIHHRSSKQATTAGHGRMAAVALPLEQAQAAIKPYAGQLVVAGVNSPKSVTIAGDFQALSQLEQDLQGSNVFFRVLDLDYAFHSPAMDPIEEPLREALAELSPRESNIRFVSTVTGDEVEGTKLGARYWWDNVRQPVLFSNAVGRLIEDGFHVFLEIGPHPVLLNYVAECAKAANSTAKAVGTLRRGEPEQDALLTSLGSCQLLGCDLDLEAFFPVPGRYVRLPAYPWQRERHWHQAKDRAADHPLLGLRASTADALWTNRLDMHRLDYLTDHVVAGTVVFPAAGYVEMALAAAHESRAMTGVELEDIDIRKALMIPEDPTPEMQLSVSGHDGSFSICSRPRGAEGAWTINVVGRLGAAASPGPQAREAIEEIRSRMNVEISANLHYQRAADLGLQYRKRFRCVKQIWANREEALGHIMIPRYVRQDLQSHYLHPAMLDACFQVVLGMVMSEGGIDHNAGYLPVQIRRLRHYGNAKNLKYCHVRLAKVGYGSILTHLTLLDRKAQVITEIEGFRLQRLELSLGTSSDVPLFEFRTLVKPGDSPIELPCVPELKDVQKLAQRLAPKVTLLTRRFHREELYRRYMPRYDALCAALAGRALKQLMTQEGEFTVESLMGPQLEQALSEARQALEKRDYRKISEYLEDAMPEEVKTTWPRAKSGRLKVDRKTLNHFSERPELASLLKGGGKIVLPQYRRMLKRLVQMVEEDGIVHKQGTGWEFAERDRLPDPNVVWRELIADYPSALPVLLLLARCGQHLPSVLTGGVDPLEIINLETLDHLYESAPETRFYNNVIEQLILEILHAWPPTRVIRILEMGAGTGGLTTNILPHLPEDRTQYVFTDVSDLFLFNAQRKYSKYPFLQYELLNIEDDPVGQGFPAYGYDIVIGANILHATRDLVRSLENSRKLLSRDGLLVLMESHQNRSQDLIFGLLKDWWNFQDVDLRPDTPLLPPGTWRHLLEDVGFEDVAVLNDAMDGMMPLQSVFLARNPGADTPYELKGTETKRSWLLFIDKDDVDYGQKLSNALTEEGHRVVTVIPEAQFKRIDDGSFALAPYDAEGFAHLCEMLKQERTGLDEVVHLWGLASTEGESAAELVALQDKRCLSTILFLQGLQKAAWSDLPNLWLVTRGAMARPGGKTHIIPGQAPLWGLGRVIENEFFKMNCKLVDLDPESDPKAMGCLLLAELLNPDTEDEILLSNGGRFVNRVHRTSIPDQMSRLKQKKQSVDKPSSFKLDFYRQGMLENLYLRAVSMPDPGPDQVLISVRATGLNFRDVMWAMGLLPAEALENGFSGPTLGMECAGEVIAVGPKVKGYKVGDEVIAFASSCFSSHILADTGGLVPKPKRLSFEEAATIPTVFFTAFYALNTLAGLQPGEKVLIHGAGGGVGLAAIQIAKLRGAEIFATAGTREKRDFVKMLGADYVLDSRSLAFADRVMEITGGAGLDVVLNSLAGEAMRKSLGLVKPFGRFLEIGKLDFYANSKLGMRPLRNNISYFSIDADQILADQPELARKVFRQMMALFEQGKLHPLVHRTYPVSRVIEAFRHMQQSKHIGKIVVSMETGHLNVVSPEKRALELRQDGTYLVTGGLGGFGLATARWMAGKGARHLVLVGRSGAATAEAGAVVDELKASGVQVVVGKADITREDQLHDVLQRIEGWMPPLRGVVHAAMVLDDGILLQTDNERLRRALIPKMIGAWNLHRQTLDKPLDFFILYSSVTTMFGNPGQGNYVAGNLYLETLAAYRRSQGLPALAVGWGSIADVGYLARETELRELLETRSGLKAITSGRALKTLEKLLLAEFSQVAAADLNWSKLLKILPSGVLPKFTSMHGQAMDGAAGTEHLENLKYLLLELPEEERLGMVTQILAEEIAKILRMSTDKVDVNRPVLNMGIDSLMGVELQMTIEKQFGVEYPAMELMGGATIAQIASRILELASIPGASRPDNEIKKEEIILQHLEEEVDAMSDEAIDLYLEELNAEKESGMQRVR